ncbi:radical SAM family heme chaperone HemW [Moraxella sp. FZLJ2107]|uniref:radical SAM family heme chaperone HemW n=1 Tax=unclassified Moraxella TaxID=2685852 RepID=UPI0020C83FA5|nr:MULTISPECIES: radical SAM family heme chaperone HemW [unclassified Moraxella]UTO05715.1 radical SAM family heme chaperone HemW [Moraxella sp. FZLJ2107]UTO22451.1 radical SAM family heme chaperone HemW [Moraxella sp. FZLJ2109]
MIPELELLPSRIPLSLYIHVPWCVKKCPYCDFNSHAAGQDAPFAEYVDALLADAVSQAQYLANRQISTVFIGGGTPSLLPIDEMVRLFAGLRKILPFADDCEITLEANPGTLEHAPFEEYLNIGINRLSIGVQSFDADALSVLGRIHNPDQAIHAIQAARAAGFRRVNCDLMHGLPQQTADKAVHDITTAIHAGATHISWYQLTIEPNTAFYRAPPDLPDEEMMDAIETAGRDVLTKHGFDNYEVSAWAGQNDTPCRHNLNYWQFGDYLAIGAGAHGKVTLHGHDGLSDGVYRFQKSRLPKDYLNYTDAPKMVNFEPVAAENLPFEFMMNALRLRNGVSTQLFEERTGLFVSTIDNELMPLQHQGLMVFDPLILAPTALGFRYVNHLVSQFL